MRWCADPTSPRHQTRAKLEKMSLEVSCGRWVAAQIGWQHGYDAHTKPDAVTDTLRAALARAAQPRPCANAGVQEQYSAACILPVSAQFAQPPYPNRVAPFLWSLPGSGNTMARLLIEASTGILTGNAGQSTDSTLLPVLHGDYVHAKNRTACLRTSVMKAHPGLVSRPQLSCEATVRSAIILVRHPLNAAFAEFQRIMAGRPCKAVLGHDASKNASKLALHATHLPVTAWVDHPWIHSLLREFVRRFMHSFGALWERTGAYGRWMEHEESRSLIVRFEDLASLTHGTCTLQRMVSFAQLSTSSNYALNCSAQRVARVTGVKRSSRDPASPTTMGRVPSELMLRLGKPWVDQHWTPRIADVAGLLGYHPEGAVEASP